LKESDFAEQRKRLVREIVAGGSLKSENVKRAFLSVPREKFFPKEIAAHAYSDDAFPIGLRQTISQPSTIAVMLEMLQAREGQKVLEVGSGSGYVAALLSEIAGKNGAVFGIELLHELHERAAGTIAELGYENVFLRCGDGRTGWKEEAPFDRILVSAATGEAPKQLAKQLAEGGRLVVPVGNILSQEMVLIEKEKGKAVEKERRCCFVFVPLR